MGTPNIFTDTTPLADPADANLVNAVITDAWGLYFAQGGVVMAAALRAMELVLDRPDLALTSASAIYCRPVACGPVTTRVDVLRNGRRGAQALALLRDQTSGPQADPGSVNVAVSAVFTNPDMEGPSMSPVPLPVELAKPPDDDRRSEPMENEFPLGFLDNTEWHVAAGPDATPMSNDPLPRLALWFRFNDPPAESGMAWDPSLLAIPGDSLGSALTVALAGGEEPIGSVSLQLDLQVLAPLTGTWVGIDSVATYIGNGLARGSVNLWSESGTHVASLTQTAMLRSFG